MTEDLIIAVTRLNGDKEVPSSTRLIVVLTGFSDFSSVRPGKILGYLVAHADYDRFPSKHPRSISYRHPSMLHSPGS
jgi:hypothetical protein